MSKIVPTGISPPPPKKKGQYFPTKKLKKRTRPLRNWTHHRPPATPETDIFLGWPNRGMWQCLRKEILDSWTCPLFYFQCPVNCRKTLDILSDIISLFAKHGYSVYVQQTGEICSREPLTLDVISNVS